MLIDVQVPVQGLTVTEATLVRWIKQAGDAVTAGEPLFEIETDKAVQEIECPASGVLLSRGASEGDVVKLGAAIGVIGTDSADRLPATGAPIDRVDQAGRPLPAPTADGRESTVVSAAAMEVPRRPEVSPRARRAAERLGVDLAAVRGTGARGLHIRERDVVAAAAASRSPQTAPISHELPSDLHEPSAPMPLTRARRVTAERTSASFRDAPHFYLSREALAERLASVREELAADAIAGDRTHVTLTDFLLKALALGLRDCPGLNAQWQNDRVISLASVDIGIAIGTPSGLYVPVIRSADAATVWEIAQRRVDLVQRALRDELRAEEMTGGSFTLTNLGKRGVDEFQAVINPPQSGILATGEVKQRPFVVDGRLGAYRTVILTLSVDHRVADGADAAEVLERIVFRIERPALLL